MTIAVTQVESRWDWRVTLRNVAVQVVLVVAAYHAYRFVRTLTEGNADAAFANSRDLLRFEEMTGLDIERGIQSVVLRSDVLIDFFNRIYVFCFWPLVSGTLVALFVFKRPLYRHYRNALFISGGIGLLVFGVFPVAPPRMLDGFVDTVHEFTDATSIARPGNFTNQYAAMPSFHVGWLVLAGAAAMPVVRRKALRPLFFVPAGVMTITVMATANHYLVDAIAGAAVALFGLWASHRLPTSHGVRQGVRQRVHAGVGHDGGVGGAATALARGALVTVISLTGGRAALTFREASADAERPRELAPVGDRPAVLPATPSPTQPEELSRAS